MILQAIQPPPLAGATVASGTDRPSASDPTFDPEACSQPIPSCGVEDVSASAALGSDGAEPPCVELPLPKRPKVGETKPQEPLIRNPPMLSPEIVAAANPPDTIEADWGGQQALKRRLDMEAKVEAERKKQKAISKQEEAAAKALAKAELKLAKAKEKAQALEQKKERKGMGKGAKRTLEPEFKAVTETGATAEQGETVKTPTKKALAKKHKDEPQVRLSPKAKSFATGSALAAKGLEKATAAYEMLQGLELAGLTLPKLPLSKKSLDTI